MPWWVVPVVMTAMSAAVIALETLWPYDPQQRILRRGLWVDLVEYGLIQSYVLGLVINPLVHWIDDATHLSSRGLISSWPIAAQLAFFVLTHDFYIYWFHRWQHKNKYLWRVH